MTTKKVCSDAAMIRNPDTWPSWPYLPMKKRDKNGRQWGSVEDKCGGVLMATEETCKNGHPTIHHVYLFGLPKTREEFRAAPTTRYDSIEAILADGWVID